MKKIIQQRTFSQPLSRRGFLSTSLKAGAAAFTTGLFPKLSVNAQKPDNILFIIADDLRPLLGCYGHPQMHTPNIDALAQRGTLFNRAYCQYPLCNPSRTSILTGLRPETTGVLSNSAIFREKLPNLVTLPQYLQSTQLSYPIRRVKFSIGRTSRMIPPRGAFSSWPQSTYYKREVLPAWQALDTEDDELPDGKTAKRAVEVLKEIQNTQFFLAVGFNRPHLPFYAPKKYYEFYENKNFNPPSHFQSSPRYPGCRQ